MKTMNKLVLLATLLVATPTTAAEVDLSATDAYGGLLAIEREATGWFRVEQLPTRDGDARWLLITPDGHPMFALGANHVGKYLDQQAEASGYLATHGSREAAAIALLDAMADLGLNAGEAYAPILPESKTRRPWLANVRYPFASKFAFDVFDKVTIGRLDVSIRNQCRTLATNPMAIGVCFTDLPIWDERRIRYYEQLPADAPGAQVLARYRSEGKSDEAFLAFAAETLYRAMKSSVAAAAPNHLFCGERFYLRNAPKAVLRAIGPHVDLFCTQALILSPQRPPEWQTFQRDGFDAEFDAVGRPMLVVDWAAPFSLGEGFDHERGLIEPERAASDAAADWLEAAAATPYVVGVFKCQLIGTHGNDKWFGDRSRRTYLQDDGRPFAYRTQRTRDAHAAALRQVYSALAD